MDVDFSHCIICGAELVPGEPCAACAGRGQDETDSRSTDGEWEYRRIRRHFRGPLETANDLGHALSEMTRDGWELVDYECVSGRFGKLRGIAVLLRRPSGTDPE